MKQNSINYLWLDGETTGIDSIKNDIVQLACIPILAGVEQDDTFNQYCQPINWNNIEPEAVAIHGITEDMMRKFQSPEAMVNNLVTYLKQFNCKFIIAGYNVGFDKEFIASLFKKVNREDEFYNLFQPDIRDTLKRAKKLKAQLPTPNIKLGTLCAHFGIEINAHDALSDIQATIKLDKILSDMLGETEIFVTEERPLLDVSFPEPAQLHIHSMFSYTDSINSIKEWEEFFAKNKVPAFSAPDHGHAASLFDIISLKGDVKGVPGIGLITKLKGNVFHLNAWATSLTGYKNLLKMASLGWNNRFEDSKVEFPHTLIRDIYEHKEGVVFGVPGINGPITQYLLTRQYDEARSTIEYLNSILDIRLELAAVDAYKYFDSAIGFCGYNIEGGNIQKHVNKLYLDLSRELNIKCIPVSDAHYIDQSDKIIQDAVCKNSFKDSRYFFEHRGVILAREMYSVLKAHLGDSLAESDFSQMIQNTLDIADQASKIQVKFDYHLPQIDIPSHIKLKTDDYNKQTYFVMMQRIKEHGRWNDSPEYVERFKKELDVIKDNATLNFIPYFLVYEDICQYARSSGLMQGIARGSAGGSLISYYLKIIHVDPVKANLPFERFLSHARIRAGSFPDIDLDIADKARPLVMKYLQDKYGLGFAQIATFNKMKTKNAIKDAMYALYGRNRNDFEVKTVCDAIDDSPQGVDEWDFLYGYTDKEGVEHIGEVVKKPILANFFKQRPEVENMVKKLIGTIRGWSRHASAFVISTIDLSADRVPTMIMSDKDVGDITVTQYDASMVEKSGLVKADILGLKTLSVISECVKDIKTRHFIDFMEEDDKGRAKIYDLPEDDGVYVDFYKKDTDSSFQFNSDVIKAAVTDFAPTQREHLSIMTALKRPGAMDAKMEIENEEITADQFYVKVRSGEKEPFFIHSDLEPILKDTYGVIVYQEQVMSILVDICGYSLEETDIIRSAIAKKKHDVMMAAFDRIRESTSKRGWTKQQSDALCNTIMAFSRYSFNRSHSWAYAELGYITMYLKHHYALEWWSSVLNNEGDEDKTRKYVAYLGNKISPPSLKHPSSKFSIKNNKIVTPISAVKSVGPSVVNEIVSKGPFESLEDYMKRIDHSRVNIGGMSALIKARAADDLMDDFVEFISLPYIERRKKFMDKYISLRKSKTAFKPEMFDVDALKIFLDEREYNQSFNKSLLSDSDVRKLLESKWPGLHPTNKSLFPYTMGDEDTTYIVSSVDAAEKLFDKGFDKEIGFFLLYNGSTHRSGISKNSGKKWELVSVDLNDGYKNIEASFWKMKRAFRWEKDSVVYVRGILQKGWRTPLNINIIEMQKIE